MIAGRGQPADTLYVVAHGKVNRAGAGAYPGAADRGGGDRGGEAAPVRHILGRVDRVRMVEQPATVAPVIIRAMAPVGPWPASRVTLLGDAIHNMTPMAGIGANTALRDASLLASTLASARPETLVTAIGQYETAMRDYGFAAVRLSLRNARQATSGPVSRTAFRAMLRAASTLPPLKRQFARALGR